MQRNLLEEANSLIVILSEAKDLYNEYGKEEIRDNGACRQL
jgi:hypothetical protein